MTKTVLDRLISQGKADLRASMAMFAKADNTEDPDSQKDEDLDEDFEDLDQARKQSNQADNAQAKPDQEPDEDEEEQDPDEEDPDTLTPGQPAAGASQGFRMAKADGTLEEFIPVDALPLIEALDARLARIEQAQARLDRTTRVMAKAMQQGMDGMLTLAKAAQTVADEPLAPRHLRTGRAQVPTRAELPAEDSGEVFAKAEEAVDAGRLSLDTFLLFNARANSIGVAEALAENPQVRKAIGGR